MNVTGGPALCKKSRISRAVSSGFSMGSRCEAPGTMASSPAGQCLVERAGVIEADRVVVARDHESGVGDAAQVVDRQRRLGREHRLGLLEHHREVLAPVG